MIYDSLDIIPYKTFLKIAETGNFLLLSDTETDEEKLSLIWEEMYRQHDNKQSSPEAKKFFRLSKEIESQETLHDYLVLAVECLRFAHNEEIVQQIRDKSYRLRDDTTENYYQDLEFIFKVSKNIKFKINQLKNQLPKEPQQNNEETELSIDDVMAAYTMIVGYDIDYNTVTYTKYHAIQRQVHLKTKALKEQSQKQK